MTPLDTLLHDTAHDMNMIHYAADSIRDRNIKNELSKEDIVKYILEIKTSTKLLSNRLDEFYKKHNDKFK